MFHLKSSISFLFITLTFLSTFVSLSVSTPISQRDLSIPSAPADPAKPADGDGIGEYDSQGAGWRDYLSKAKFYTIAVAAGEIGLTNAERGMRHYLGNSGDDLDVSPESMMRGLPKFLEQAHNLAQNEAAAAYKKIDGSSGSLQFSSAWNVYYATKDESWDWFYAIGGFSYSVTGVVTKTSKDGGSLEYRVHIFDRYNWDAGKSVTIGPFTFEDRELGELHLKGLAREYTVRGSGQVNKVKDFTPTTVIPPPTTGGRS